MVKTNMDDNQKKLEKQMQERLEMLPDVVQRAIKSTEISTHLRELANTHKLHLDQWEVLENEVRLALLGFSETEDLPQAIATEVGVDEATARALAEDISKSIFEPIREELERQLSHPKAQAEEKSGVETMRDQVLTNEASVKAPPVQPATPPPAPPTGKVERAQISSNYAPETPSHERKNIDGDPYREQFA